MSYTSGNPARRSLTHPHSTNANAYKICFWLLCYLLHQRTTLESVKRETEPSVKPGGIDVELLLQCPLLNAAFQETLRLTGGASSARTVIAPTQLDQKTLQKDAKVLMPYRQLHFDERAFGKQITEFHPERFLQDQDLARSPYFKPFGGGITYCSGRFIAKREVFAFVAFVLHRYDIELENPGQALPRLDERKPTLGVIGPIQGDDTRVLLEKRS